MGGSRREFIAAVAGLVVSMEKSRAVPGASSSDPLALDGPRLLEALRSGDLSAEGYTRSALRRLQECSDLNIVTWKSEQAVLEAARSVDRRRGRGEPVGYLAGAPILVKDNINTVGFATTAGTEGLKNYQPTVDATVVSGLRAQGGLVLAKTNMHELACGSTSSNAFFGPVRNPYSPQRISGGSSGGTAAGLAARATVFGFGSDSAGSARIPASFCGVAGFRPSFGPGHRRYSSDGIVPLARELDTCGPMGRTVADVIALDEVITGRPTRPTAQLRGARLGISRADHWTKLDPEVGRVGERALGQLRAAGVELVEVDLRPVNKEAEEVFWTLLLAGMQQDIGDFLAREVPGVSLEKLISGIRSVDVREVFEKNLRERVNPAALEAAKLQRRRAQQHYQELFQRHQLDAVIFPTVPVLAPLIRSNGDRLDDTVLVAGKPAPAGLTGIRHTMAACALGAPALSIPAGLSADSLPVGLEIDGVPGADERILALGRQIELLWGPLPAPRLCQKTPAHSA
jgi:indoleacetamide hydrolase